jgi:glycerophosphoryl diester phosphodiesterase
VSRALRIAALGAALALLVLSFINASWLAEVPRGRIKLIALHGAHQIATGPCPAIEPPLHDYLGDTRGGVGAAGRLGAQVVSVSIEVTRDGHLVLLGEPDLGCRTNGTGMVSERTLAQVQALDAGHGYSADGGKTFPFRGRAVGAIPRLEDVLALMADRPLLFDLPADPRAGPQLVETLRVMGRDPVRLGDGFRGLAADLAPIRAAFPKAWLWDRTRAAACAAAYRWQGWLGLTPSQCRGQTLVVPMGGAWAFAGWPNKVQARMDAVGARVVMTGPGGAGLTLPEQLSAVPASFTGYLMVEDIWTVGPALRPAFNRRTPLEEQELAKALEARRAQGQ